MGSLGYRHALLHCVCSQKTIESIQAPWRTLWLCHPSPANGSVHLMATQLSLAMPNKGVENELGTEDLPG